MDAMSEVQILVPQQTAFYQAQLRAVANFALQGAGADLGAGSDARQYFLHVAGSSPQNVSSFVWRNPADPNSTNFVVLPPQDLSRRYFGVASGADGTGDKMWVEGVDLHATGSRYGRLLVSYNNLVEPATRVPLAIGALIDAMRTHLVAPDEERQTTSLVGLAPETHRRLGNALISFWNTVTPPADLSSERFSIKGAYDLTSLILRHQIELAVEGKTDGRHTTLRPYLDARDNVTGFVGEDEQNKQVNIMVRDNTQYPERINYISWSTPNPEAADEDVVVSHYVITRDGVGARLCVLPSGVVMGIGVRGLVTKIQRHDAPLETLPPEEIGTIIRGLHSELGDLLGKGDTPSKPLLS